MEPPAPSPHTGWALGLAVSLANGFLIGRNLTQPDVSLTHKPGLRDCLLFALLGAVGATLGQPVLAATLLLGGTAILVITRWQNQVPRGLTSELAVLLCFILGYAAMTEHLPLAAAVGIIAAALLAEKETLHRLATTTFSHTEFIDTLKFLALIFIIYPLLPAGSTGPYGFFEPRKIWFFVILVSSVSYFGYFFAKYFSEKNGRLLTALLGGLASTTAYTGVAAKMVADQPSIAVPMVRATLLANAIMFPRMALLILVLQPGLTLRAAPVLLTMTAVGLLSAWWLGRSGDRPAVSQSGQFANPFALRPALTFGLLFTLVLFLVRAGHAIFQQNGQTLTGFLGGFLDVDAVVLSFCEFYQNGQTDTLGVVRACVLAGLANAFFKSFLTLASRQPSYYLRVMGGFVLIFASGALVLLLL